MNRIETQMDHYMQLKNEFIAKSHEDVEAQHSRNFNLFSANCQKEIAESKARETNK